MFGLLWNAAESASAESAERNKNAFFSDYGGALGDNGGVKLAKVANPIVFGSCQDTERHPNK